MTMRIATALLAVLLLAGCHEKDRQAALPPAQAITDSAVAQFCGMNLTEHPGPKGQIFVRGDARPLWFASARDTIAFTLLPEMPKNLAAIYVTDMAQAGAWDHPAAASWVDARKAWFVIDSRRKGGMDTDEAVPFGTAASAQSFATAHGGRVVRFGDIPPSYVFGSEGSGS